MADDRWWRGYDAVILSAVAPGSRVLDVGCGDGGLVERLAAGGLDPLGVDPDAPAHPRLVQQRVEVVCGSGRFDAACAIMSLHHAELEPVLAAIARLLTPGGLLFAYELEWESYDERAAAWLAEHDPSDADNSVSAWQVEHTDLNTGAATRAALEGFFDVRSDLPRPYLARMLGMRDREAEEQALIADGSLPALGRWYVASQPPEG
jgi:SAM-dependent methyltransferase